MNGIKFLMALVAACILIMPAFSMPHVIGQDCKQKSCDCQQNMMGQDNKEKMWQGQDNKEMMWQGQDDKQKTCGCPESMMGKDNKEKMWQGQDDKQKMCDDLMPKMEQDGKQMWQGQDDKQKTCGCPESMMGQDGKQMGHKHVKSMMGDREKGDNGEIKVVIVNLHV